MAVILADHEIERRRGGVPRRVVGRARGAAAPGDAPACIEDQVWAMADAFGPRVVSVGEIGRPRAGPAVRSSSSSGSPALCDRAAAHGLLVALEFTPWSGIPDIATAAAIVTRRRSSATPGSTSTRGTGSAGRPNAEVLRGRRRPDVRDPARRRRPRRRRLAVRGHDRAPAPVPGRGRLRPGRLAAAPARRRGRRSRVGRDHVDRAHRAPGRRGGAAGLRRAARAVIDRAWH